MRLLGTADLDLLERVFDQLPDSPFFIKNEELRYVAANDAMAGLCGVRRPSDLYGRTAPEFFPEPLALRYEALDRQVLLTGTALTNKLDLSKGTSGESAWLLFSRLPVTAADGDVVGVLGSSRRLKPGDKAHSIYVRLAKVAERLRERPDEPLQLPQLAKLAGVSKSQLERDFMRLFGTSPQAFLQQLRIDRALHLLRGEMSVARIAYECGYSDHSAFTRVFRREYGMTPRQYRADLAWSSQGRRFSRHFGSRAFP